MATGYSEAVRNAPRSDWPVRGSITQSCGCTTDDAESVAYADYDCDPVDGFQPVVVYAEYCPWCALRLKVSGYYLADSEAQDRWQEVER